MVWSVWLLISKKWTQSTILSGLMALSMAKFSRILSMSILNTALKSVEDKDRATYFFIQNYFRVNKIDMNLADKLELEKQKIKVVDYVN